MSGSSRTSNPVCWDDRYEVEDDYDKASECPDSLPSYYEGELDSLSHLHTL